VATEELAINKPGELFVRQRGSFSKYSVDFSYDDLEDIAILAGALRKQDVGPQNPLCSTELPNGERLQICLPPTVPSGTVSLTIRRPSFSVADLGSVGSRYKTSGWNKWNQRQERSHKDHGSVLTEYDR